MFKYASAIQCLCLPPVQFQFSMVLPNTRQFLATGHNGRHQLRMPNDHTSLLSRGGGSKQCHICCQQVSTHRSLSSWVSIVLTHVTQNRLYKIINPFVVSNKNLLVSFIHKALVKTCTVYNVLEYKSSISQRLATKY